MKKIKVFNLFKDDITDKVKDFTMKELKLLKDTCSIVIKVVEE